MPPAATSRTVEIGQAYRHWKGNEYRVVAIARYTDGELLVLYVSTSSVPWDIKRTIAEAPASEDNPLFARHSETEKVLKIYCGEPLLYPTMIDQTLESTRCLRPYIEFQQPSVIAQGLEDAELSPKDSEIVCWARPIGNFLEILGDEDEGTHYYRFERIA